MQSKIIKIFGSTPIAPVIATGVAILHFVVVGFLCTEKTLLVSGARFRRAETPENAELQILEKILQPDVRTRPRGINLTESDGGPTIVKVKMIIRSISDIDDHKMEYKVQLTLRCFWEDERLRFSDESGKVPYVTLMEHHRIWMPDLFFRNEKNGKFHNVLLPNLYARIYPDGKVFYSIRISLTLICPMNLKLFPLDKQKCQLPIASFSQTSKNLVLSWKNDEPVQISDVLLLKDFTLEKIKTKNYDTESETGIYSCLDVDLIFKRVFFYYQTTVYIPCAMLVILSWITFLFDSKAFGSKVTLGITTLLTMSFMTFAVNQTLPKVSYTKAIDVWTGVSLTFVFAVMLEIALISYFLSLEKNEAYNCKVLEEEIRDCTTKSQDQNLSLEEDPKAEPNRSPSNKFQTFILSRLPLKWSSRIDIISRIIFPVFYIIFVIAYFSTYRNANTDDWHYPLHSNVRERGYSYSVEV